MRRWLVALAAACTSCQVILGIDPDVPLIADAGDAAATDASKIAEAGDASHDAAVERGLDGGAEGPLNDAR